MFTTKTLVIIQKHCGLSAGNAVCSPLLFSLILILFLTFYTLRFFSFARGPLGVEIMKVIIFDYGIFGQRSQLRPSLTSVPFRPFFWHFLTPKLVHSD